MQTLPVQETVNKMCLDHPDLKSGLQILNVGFGLGIVWSPYSRKENTERG